MGLEIAPGNEVEDLSLIEDVGQRLEPHPAGARVDGARSQSAPLCGPCMAASCLPGAMTQPAVLWFQRSVFRPCLQGSRTMNP